MLFCLRVVSLEYSRRMALATDDALTCQCYEATNEHLFEARVALQRNTLPVDDKAFVEKKLMN